MPGQFVSFSCSFREKLTKWTTIGVASPRLANPGSAMADQQLFFIFIRKGAWVGAIFEHFSSSEAVHRQDSHT